VNRNSEREPLFDDARPKGDNKKTVVAGLAVLALLLAAGATKGAKSTRKRRKKMEKIMLSRIAFELQLGIYDSI
jgi:hypothetical protein